MSAQGSFGNVYKKSICWCKDFLSVHSKLSKPGPLCHFLVNGASEKEEVQNPNSWKTSTVRMLTTLIFSTNGGMSRGQSVLCSSVVIDFRQI